MTSLHFLLFTMTTISTFYLVSAQVDNLQCHILVVNGRNNSAYCCNDAQCKSTICSEHECKCKSTGGACAKNVECCSNNCNVTTRKCICSAKLADCNLGSDCCTGFCTSDKVCGPKDDGAVCGQESDCAGNYCNPNKICGCMKPHEPCVDTGDCCTQGGYQGVTCSRKKCCILPGEGLNPEAESCCSGILEGNKCA